MAGRGVGRVREAAFRILVRVHPRDFRERHGRELLDHLRASWRDEVDGRGRVAAVEFWWRMVRGSLTTVAAQRIGGSSNGDSKNGREAMRMDALAAEARLALRALARRPGTTLVVIVTLGLGLGANTAVFSVLHSVLVAPLPYEDADRLVRIYGNRRDLPGEFERMYLTGPATTELRDDAPSLESVAVLDNYTPEFVDVTGAEAPERVRLLRVNAEYFDVLGVTPLVGTTFARSDEHAESRAVVVRENLWRRYLGGTNEAVGRTLLLDGEGFTVVGVLPDAVRDPVEGRVDVWAAADLSGDDAGNWNNNYLSAFARLRPDVGVETLLGELDVLEARHDDIDEDAAEKGYAVVPLRDDLVGGAEPVLTALTGAVLFLLLLTCVNVASILLAGASSRQREMAVRRSLGSSRSSLVRLFVLEAGLLAVGGGLLGFLLGSLALDALLVLAPAQLPRLSEVGMGGGVVLLAASATLAIGVAIGLATALPFTRAHTPEVLTGSRGGDATRATSRLRGGLVVVEVALAVVLLTGAGVLIRTIQELQTRDLGAEPEGVLTFQVGLPEARYPDDAAKLAFLEELQQRVASIPEVESVATTSRLPVTGTFNTWGTRPAIAVGEPVDMDNVQVNQRWTLGAPFGTTGVELLAGRLFEPADDADAPRVVVVNRAFVERLFPDEDPIGRLVRISGWYPRIVGVVEDEAITSRLGPEPMAYHDLRQWPIGSRQLVHMVRTGGEPTELVGAVRAELRAIDPDLVLFEPRALTDVIGAGIAMERFAAQLLAVFAMLAILLAGLGLYGILSHLVGRQRHEIGVRMALGADASGVRSLVVGRGLRLTAAGLVVGIVVAVGVSGWLRPLLYGSTAYDATVLASVPVILVVIALVASWLPAIRATRVDPVRCFRAE